MAAPNKQINPAMVFNTTPEVQQKKKYCRFKKNGIKYIDYKDGNFLLKFVNEQCKILPRRLTGTSLKYQRKIALAVRSEEHTSELQSQR